MKFLSFIFSISLCAITSQINAQKLDLTLDKIELPPGFSINVWAHVPDAHAMTLGDKGTVFVGSKTAGSVYAITENDGERQVRTIASKLKMPTGVAFHNGALYVSSVNKILRFDSIENTLDHPAPPRIITADYPKETYHGWRYIAFGPDDWLYISVGSPCNICENNLDRFALISRIKPDGTNYEVFARGVRNTEGFDWHPATKELWFTDISREWMGDNLPPDELNHASKKGMHFGFPYCHGQEVADPKLGAKHDCNKFIPPVVELDPHVTPKGMRFYTGSMFPSEYRGNIFIAEHGSRNRSTKTGYRIERIQLEANKMMKKEIFAEGWLQDNEAWGRPVDILITMDGAMLVSDDMAGVIYRISYNQP
ncbi:sorbosone dehydrogenase family protein [Nitrosomonas sp. HPC101]|uniref:PQQ-dependent sugar dehydrogenase n=1 Tax=Nitrosomonas sp. HPC101 TaxID=1658667 RepID=UPI00136B9B86|nr:PQQ-dependent sugar dehydrogenase [Nitrosomonas sp. HPC101]MXS84669.1 sorbosone dehydrogenase family protein [Nitrosomonas sp. HPC101]